MTGEVGNGDEGEDGTGEKGRDGIEVAVGNVAEAVARHGERCGWDRPTPLDHVGPEPFRQGPIPPEALALEGLANYVRILSPISSPVCSPVF